MTMFLKDDLDATPCAESFSDSLSPADAALITYEILGARQHPMPHISIPAHEWVQPIATPITFWQISYKQQDEGETNPDRGTSGKFPISLTIYERHAGRIGSAGMDVADADKAAAQVFAQHQNRFIELGYSMQSIEIGVDRMKWIGISNGVSAMGKRLVATVEAVRGPARPDDPAILELAKLLKANPLKLWH